MKIKTSELTGAALDWAVAKCDDRRINFNPGGGLEVRGRTEEGAELPEAWDLWMPWHPSTTWAQGGEIIEREKISTTVDDSGVWIAFNHYNYADEKRFMRAGPTPLTAAMRCFISSRLGDEVEVPEELAC